MAYVTIGEAHAGYPFLFNITEIVAGKVAHLMET